MAGKLEGQMAFALFDERELPPTWEDVQKGRARAVVHGAYSRPCSTSCLWSGNVCGGRCYLLGKPVVDGMCPSTTHLEWR